MTPPNGAAVFARHDLLYVDAHAWREVLVGIRAASSLSAEEDRLAEGWADRGWPVIVRRRLPEDAEGLAVALSLPPHHEVRRLALVLPLESTITRCPPVLLPEIAAGFSPPVWQETIENVLALGDSLHIVPRVFGAVMWQHLTGLDYLHATSDLDLLWQVPRLDALPALLQGLRTLDASAPMRLDGEIRLSHDEWVPWRELDRTREDGGQVLLKTVDRLVLRDVGSVFPVRAAAS